MNTFNRAQGMDNQKLGQFTSEIKYATSVLIQQFMFRQTAQCSPVLTQPFDAATR